MFKFKQSFNFVPHLIKMEYNDKQLQILKVAEDLFSDKGFDGTSVRDIAKEADVNVAMISYYFGSKEKLLQAIFQQRIEETKIQIESVMVDKSLAPLEKIYRLIDTYVDKILSRPNFHKLMVSIQVTQSDDIITSAIYESKKRNHDLIKKIIQEGQKTGVFKASIDIPIMMATMVGTSNQLLTSNHFYRKAHNLEDVPEDEFKKMIRRKLSIHLKKLFKAILTYEK